MTAPTKPQPRKLPNWLAWLKISITPPSVIESEYQPALKVGDKITHIVLQTVAASIITSAVGYVSLLVFSTVLAYGSLEQALAAVIGNFLFQAAQARGGPYDVSLLLSGLAVACVLVFIVGKFIFDAFDIYTDDDEGLTEIHEHLKMLEDKLSEIYYALPARPASPAAPAADDSPTA